MRYMTRVTRRIHRRADEQGFTFIEIMVVVAILAILAIMATPALDDGIPRGLGHPQAGETHFYDMSCCNQTDCEPVEPGALIRTPEGLRIRYMTSGGVLAEGFLPWGSTGIRPSKDGREHACAIGSRAACAYFPPES